MKDNVIRSQRFNSDRNRKAKLQADYCAGLGEINAPVPGMEQLHATRGRDPVAQDVRFIMLGLCAGLVVGLVLTGWKFWPAVEAALGVTR